MNKAALRTQFKALLNRNDCSNTLADTFIDQAVARVQRNLRIPSMEKAASITFSELLPDSFILPNDFLDFIDIFYEDATGGRKLSKLPRASFLRHHSTGGKPSVYIRTGAAVQIKPAPHPDTSLSLLYYGELDDLVADTDSNQISDTVPELIIYGALSFAGDYFVDDRKPQFEEVYRRIYEEVEQQARDLEFSGADMAVQSVYPNAEY